MRVLKLWHIQNNGRCLGEIFGHPKIGDRSSAAPLAGHLCSSWCYQSHRQTLFGVQVQSSTYLHLFPMWGCRKSLCRTSHLFLVVFVWVTLNGACIHIWAARIWSGNGCSASEGYVLCVKGNKQAGSQNQQGILHPIWISSACNWLRKQPLADVICSYLSLT